MFQWVPRILLIWRASWPGAWNFNWEPRHKFMFFPDPSKPCSFNTNWLWNASLRLQKKYNYWNGFWEKRITFLKVVNRVLSWACILVPCINEQFNVFTVSPPSFLPEIFASFSYNVLKSSTQTHHKSFQMTHFQYSPKLFIHMSIERIQV